MMYHTCQNSKYKYLFSIFETFPSECSYAPLHIEYNVNTRVIQAERSTHNKYSGSLDVCSKVRSGIHLI